MVSVIAAIPRRRAFSLAGLLLAALVVRAEPLPGQVNACALVRASDVAALLGGTPLPTPAPKGTSCVWKTADPNRKLAVLSYLSRAPGEMMYAGAHGGAEKEPESKLTDESGLGDKAFSITPSFGAAFIVLKHGKVLQLQYHTGAQGTEKDRDALRVVVRKAVAAF